MLNIKEDILEISLPEGKTNEELLSMIKDELSEFDPSSFYGKDIKITGRITTHLALFLGHFLAHNCKSVSLFDPKQNKFVLVIKH